jgi:hypothetical protein
MEAYSELAILTSLEVHDGWPVRAEPLNKRLKLPARVDYGT